MIVGEAATACELPSISTQPRTTTLGALGAKVIYMRPS
jgi:hypothetical protein